MRYFDKSNRPITRDQWRELFGNKRYSLIARSSNDKLTVDTSWVGISPESERVPLTFLTRTVNTNMTNKSELKTKLPDIWSWNAEAAMKAHDERCREIGVGKPA